MYAGNFCPTNDDATCALGLNYRYYAQKLIVTLFVDFVLLMRASSVFKFEKTQTYLCFAIIAFHLFAEGVFMYLSCDIDFIHESCRNLLGF